MITNGVAVYTPWMVAYYTSDCDLTTPTFLLLNLASFYILHGGYGGCEKVIRVGGGRTKSLLRTGTGDGVSKLNFI